MIARIFLAIALLGAATIVGAAACEGIEDVDARLSCLKEQYCADAASDAARAQCYEAILRSVLSGTMPPDEPQPPQVAPRTAPPAAAESAVSEGEKAPPELDRPAAPTAKSESEDLFGRKPERSPDEPDRIVANLARVVEQPDGRALFALDNGQVWEENEVSFRPRKFKIGSTVGVSKVMFGYIMRFEKGMTTRVSRLACDSSYAERDVLSKCRRAGHRVD